MTNTAIEQNIIRLLEAACIPVNTEAQAQDCIELLLTGNFAEVRREVRLSARDRVDFMVGEVAIEVKVRKGQSRKEIMLQLERYASHSCVKSVVLASAGAWACSTVEVGGKPLYFANLSRGWL